MAQETLRTESTIWLFGRELQDISFVNPLGRRLVRVYGFAFHNEYFGLGAPTIFVVSGSGTLLDDVPNPPHPWQRAAVTGLGVTPRFAKDLRVWEVDMSDMSSRLDVMTGNFERILLDVELAEDGLQDFVRGGAGLGQPSNLGGDRRRRGRRWRSDDD